MPSPFLLLLQLPANTLKGPESAMITLFCNENFQESLPHLPLQCLLLWLDTHNTLLWLLTSLNYFLECPPPPHYMWLEGIPMEMAPQDISSPPKDHSLATYVSLSFALEIHLLSLGHMVPRFVI